MLCSLQRLNGEAEVSCTEEQLHSKHNAFAVLRKENMEYEQNVEDYKTKLSERYSIKAKTVEGHTTSHIRFYYTVEGH